MVSSKIQRLPEHLERYNQASNYDDDYASLSKPQYPIEILSMKEKYIWRCQLDLNLVLPNKTLRQLIGITGCVIVKSLNENIIYIGSTSEESIHLAILKLDNLAKYAVSWVL
jgi:hypothetical protein